MKHNLVKVWRKTSLIYSYLVSSECWPVGFSPVWVLMWFLRTCSKPKDLLHWAHLCIFLPEWQIRWFLRVAKRPNDLLHWAHLCNFSPLCMTMMRWLFRWTAWPNDLLHWANLCNFAPLLGFRIYFSKDLSLTVTQKASITEIKRRSGKWGLPHIVTPSRHVEDLHILLLIRTL